MERLETLLTLVISLLSAVAALLTAVNQLLHLYRQWSVIEDDALADLSRDVLRLEAMVQQQKAELERFKHQHSESIDIGQLKRKLGTE